MKRLLATLLTLAFALGMVTPVWAEDIPEAAPADLIANLATTTTTVITVPAEEAVPAPYTETKDSYYYDNLYIYEGSPSYRTGYAEGYEAGWQEGLDDSQRDLSNGTDFAPKYHYDIFTEEETGWETYEDGYQNGVKYGYWRGYYDTYYQDVYDAGYAEGYALGLADSLANSYVNEPSYPADEGDDIDYKRQVGLYDGYWQAYNESWQANWEAQLAAERDARLAALGGTPGQINVRLNDKMIPFPAAAPEFRNGRTMLPVRALMEAIDATVTWDEATQTVTVERGDLTLLITVGSDKATLTVGGETQTLTLDAPAYQKNDCTYVPLRLIGETLGYDVYWDDAHQTVVLLDRAAIIAGIDEKFTVYNSFIAAHKYDLEARKQITERLDIKLTLYDTIDGNLNLSFPMQIDVMLGDGGMTAEGTIDLSGLKALIGAYVPEADMAQDGDLPTTINLIAKKQSFACKLTPDGMLYLKYPLLDELMTSFGEEVAIGTWYAMDLNQAFPGWTTLFDYGTLGELMYGMTFLQTYSDPIDYYDILTASAAPMEAFIADAAFTKSGSEYRLSLGLEDLIEMMRVSMGDYGDEYAEDAINSLRQTFSAFSLDMRLKADGSYTMSCNIKMQADYLGSVFSMEQKGSGNVNGSEQTMTIQLKNVFTLTMKETMKVHTRNIAPDFTLPGGATVLDLLGGGASAPEPAPFLANATRVLAQIETALF